MVRRKSTMFRHPITCREKLVPNMKFAIKSFVVVAIITLSSVMAVSSADEKRTTNLEQIIVDEGFGDDICTLYVRAHLGKDGRDWFSVTCSRSADENIPVSASQDWIKKNMRSGLLVPGRSKMMMGGTYLNSAGEIATIGDFEVFYDPDSDTDRRVLLTNSGNRKVLVVRIQATDAATSDSEYQLADSVFGVSLGVSSFTDPVNLATQYRACSKNRLVFSPARASGINYGVTTVSLGISTSAGKNAIETAVGVALQNKFPGINFQITGPGPAASGAYLADHVMYCYPPGVVSSGYGQIYSWQSGYDDGECDWVMMQMHEIGHNLGLSHDACFDPQSGVQDYGDESGVMGISYLEDDSQSCPNGVKLWDLGWYSSGHYTWSEGDNSAISLQGIVGTSGSSYYIVKIPASQTVDGSSDIKMDYYCWFNLQQGYNSGTHDGANQVLVARKQDTSSFSKWSAYAKSTSYLVAKLSAGDSYTIDADGGGCPTITVSSINAGSTSGTAIITITGCGGSSSSVEQQSESSSVCYICTGQSYPKNPSAQIQSNFFSGKPTCGNLYDMGMNGQISDSVCSQIQASYQEICGCVSISSYRSYYANRGGSRSLRG